ncbi:MAG: 16S rRNA (cytosine(1402)-N(4))-methyltransferase RsmH, partial [Actinomycetia bacterium]|nr:16S rRNA (cytosine(1402)-N(4))-methyltransferase RsmH [Actinomycetes bacterium]
GDIVFDGTLGGAGHTVEIIKAIAPTGKVIGVELHSQTLSTAARKLGSLSGSMIPVNDNFVNIREILKKLGIAGVNGILLDLGLSSFLIEHSGRGFSYVRDEKLDMRFSSKQQLDAFEIVNNYSTEKLSEIFKKYGEERFSGRIAWNIEKKRKERTISTTGELAKIIRDSIPGKYAGKRKGNPAKRVFQAIRIEVNGELDNLDTAITDGFGALEGGGRMVIISYHSLEDRLVKKRFRDYEGVCKCPPGLPVCKCGVKKRAKLLTKGAVFPSQQEKERNPRSGSARLRALEKVKQV